MNLITKIWKDNNTEPPKNYLWEKDGVVYKHDGTEWTEDEAVKTDSIKIDTWTSPNMKIDGKLVLPDSIEPAPEGFDFTDAAAVFDLLQEIKEDEPVGTECLKYKVETIKNLSTSDYVLIGFDTLVGNIKFEDINCDVLTQDDVLGDVVSIPLFDSGKLDSKIFTEAYRLPVTNCDDRLVSANWYWAEPDVTPDYCAIYITNKYYIYSGDDLIRIIKCFNEANYNVYCALTKEKYEALPAGSSICKSIRYIDNETDMCQKIAKSSDVQYTELDSSNSMWMCENKTGDSKIYIDFEIAL